MKMEIRIVPFAMNLYDEVVALWRQCKGIGLSEADSRENMVRYLERNPGMSLVAIGNRTVLGVVLAGHDGRRGYLHHLAVAEKYRNRGVGRMLVAGCLDKLAEAGIDKSHIFLFRDNSEGERFWQSIGWNVRSDLKVVSKMVRQ